MQTTVSQPRLDERLSPGHRFMFGMAVICLHTLLLPWIPGVQEAGMLIFVISPVVFILPPVLLARGLGAQIRESFALHPVQPGQLGWSLLIGVGIVPAMGLLGALNAQWIQPSTEALEFIDELTPTSPASWVAMILAVAILTPLGEEFLFRGVLQDAATPALGVAPAAVVVGLIFGAVHFQPWYLLPLCVVGMILGLVRMLTGSVFACAAVHGAYNLGMLLLGRFGADEGNPDRTSVLVLLFFAISGLWMAWMAVGRLRPVPDAADESPDRAG